MFFIQSLVAIFIISRNIHNTFYDSNERCLWIMTIDYGKESKILRASLESKR